MIKIKTGSRILEVIGLNDDCNYEINQQPVITALSYVTWSFKELKLLQTIINWDIYSDNDLDEQIIEEFRSNINFAVYLRHIELKYKEINLALVKKILLFRPYPDSLIGCILNRQANNNKDFYFKNAEFLITFKFVLDVYKCDDVLKYINTSELLESYTGLLPRQIFEQLLPRITIKPDAIERIFTKIVNRFESFRYDQDNIISVLFITQKFSFEFITARVWTHNVWKHILSHQDLTDDQLLTLIADKKYGSTLRLMICKYKTLSDEFIEKYINILDMNEISRYQPLSYEFVKRNIDQINMGRLIENEKIKFAITEIHDDSLIGGPQYIIIKNINYDGNVLFID